MTTPKGLLNYKAEIMCYGYGSCATIIFGSMQQASLGAIYWFGFRSVMSLCHLD